MLIINRLRAPDTIIGKLSIKAVETYQKPDSVYLLQGRNDNTGQLMPMQKSIPLGKKDAVALKS